MTERDGPALESMLRVILLILGPLALEAKEPEAVFLFSVSEERGEPSIVMRLAL